MRCDEARENLHGDAGRLGHARLGLHLLRCRACRAGAREIRALDSALSALPRFTPSAELLPAVLAQAQARRQTTETQKETRTMKRLAYAVAFLIIAGLLAGGLLTKARPPDGRALLISAAEAMEEAKTIHVVFRGTEAAPDSPTGFRMMPGRGEMWLSDRTVALRYVDSAGELLLASYLDCDTALWWVYDRSKQSLYEANLGAVRERLPQIVAKVSRRFRGEQLVEMMTTEYPDAQESVSTERHEGRLVRVVTFVYTHSKQPRHITARRVFEVDPETARLITARRYAKVEGAPEELIDSLDKVEYDVPMPPGLAEPRCPNDTQTIETSVTLEETSDTVSLVMQHNGVELGRMDTAKAD